MTGIGRIVQIVVAVVVVAIAILAVPSKFSVPVGPGAILVTGAGSGIGRHVAERLVSTHGEFSIYGVVRQEAQARELQQAGIKPLIADLTHDGEIAKALATIEDNDKPLVGIFHAAGLPFPNMPIEYLDINTMKDVYNVSVFGLFALLQAVLPLLKQSDAARIVLMGSVTGVVSPPFMGADAARAGEAIADTLRRELMGTASGKISLSVIQAGFINSPIIGKIFKLDQAWREQVIGDDKTTLQQIVDKEYPHLKEKDYDKQVPLDEMAPMSVVSDAVLDAMFSPRPRIKYICGATPILPVWLLVPLMNVLPHSIVDLMD